MLSNLCTGSEKIKKSVLKLFGKEEISEEDAVAQAKSIVADVMSLTAKPLDINDLLSDEVAEHDLSRIRSDQKTS